MLTSCMVCASLHHRITSPVGADPGGMNRVTSHPPLKIRNLLFKVRIIVTIQFEYIYTSYLQ